MDCQKSQAPHLSEVRHFDYPRAGVVYGMQGSREELECAGAEREGFGNTVVRIADDNRDSVADADYFGRLEGDIRFRSLLGRLRGVEFSWSLSVKLLGGEKRLRNLLTKGKIHATKKSGAPNTMWRFNAVEVVAYVKPDKKFL